MSSKLLKLAFLWMVIGKCSSEKEPLCVELKEYKMIQRGAKSKIVEKNRLLLIKQCCDREDAFNCLFTNYAVPSGILLWETLTKHLDYIKKGPSIVNATNFEPKNDSKALKEALSGLGTNENVIINILSSRTWIQRKAIASTYKRLYNKDLKLSLIEESSGHFASLLEDLLTPTDEVYAMALFTAMDGIGTDEEFLTSLFLSETSWNLGRIFEKFQKLYKYSISQYLRDELSGSLHDVFVQLWYRSQGGGKSMSLYKMNKLLSKYKSDHGHLKNLFQEMATIYRFGQASYIAGKINDTGEGWGTNDDRLRTWIVLRAEKDLHHIEIAFRKLYGKDLSEFIQKETSGAFRDLLISLL